jgi:hypothetical protein
MPAGPTTSAFIRGSFVTAASGALAYPEGITVAGQRRIRTGLRCRRGRISLMHGSR